MAGTEWASEIRVVNASDTLRLILRPRRAMGIVLYRGPRSFSCCFPPSLARLRRRNRRAGQAAGGAYVLMRRRRRLRYEL